MLEKVLVLIFSSLVLMGISVQAGGEPQALTMARRRYKAELKPIQNRYVRNLEMMKRKYTQRNDHEAVGVINAEIGAVKAFQTEKASERAESSADGGVSVAGKCFLYYPPDNKWMKVLYLRPDGKIVGSNHPSEVNWIQKGKVVAMTDGEGKTTGQFRYKKQQDDSLYFENAHQGNVMVIMREPTDK